MPMVLVLVASALLGTIVAASQIELPYFALRPGSVLDSDAAIQIDGAPTYDSEGTIHYTTVSVRQTSALEWVLAHFDSDADLVHRDQILGDRDPEENRQHNRELMDQSQLVAPTVALEALGYEVPTSISGIVVGGVEEDMPAEGELKPGDVIVEIEGQALDDLGVLEDVMSEQEPGDELDLVVLPFDAARDPFETPLERPTTCTAEEEAEADEATEQGEVDPAREAVKVELDAALAEPEMLEERTVGTAEDPETADRAMMGVAPVAYGLEHEFPVDICFDTGDVGGPSAGLAFTLALVDLMSPGDLTGGLEIAVTGTMAMDGSVGSVGGTGQKAAAAHSNGMDVFLVPAAGADFENAEAHSRDVDVIPVATLDEALEALEELGGDPLELPLDDAP